jgi:two-component system sensor histidine kinase CreC
VQQENNVSELIYEVTEDFKAIANSKKVEFKVNSDTELSLVADTFLLKQALSNLVKNALEYSPSNGLIEITAHKDKSSIALSVADEGPGIPDYAKSKIFDRFYSTPKPSGGNSSGLGLCFVKEIMSLHLGSVVVESSEGNGTIMTLLFTNKSNRNK